MKLEENIYNHLLRQLKEASDEDQAQPEEESPEIEPQEDEEPTVTTTISLLIRLLEWAKEEAEDDVDLHELVEKISAMDGPVGMDAYEDLISATKEEDSEELEESEITQGDDGYFYDDEGNRSEDDPRKPAYRMKRHAQIGKKYYFNVAFREREEAKKEGMRFDPDKKKWYHTSLEKANDSSFDPAEVNEGPVSLIGQGFRKLKAGALNAIGAKGMAANVTGKIQGGDKANAVYNQFQSWLGQRNKKYKEATADDVIKFASTNETLKGNQEAQTLAKELKSDFGSFPLGSSELDKFFKRATIPESVQPNLFSTIREVTQR